MSVKIFKKSINAFIEKGKLIEGVYDLLLRGSGTINYSSYDNQWDDLDLSIIVNNINKKVLLQEREIYNAIKAFCPYKVSITLIALQDFTSLFHHHGIKPVYYNQLLRHADSLLRGKIDIACNISLIDQKKDCISNIYYLIHELRNRWLKVNLDCNKDLTDFLHHTTKSTKHFIRNSIFIVSGRIDEEICKESCRKLFPVDYSLLLDKLKYYKYVFSNELFKPSLSNEKIVEEILFFLERLDKGHLNLLKFINKVEKKVKKRESK